MGRKSDARERLINAAIEMIWRVSYGEITIDALCERAKVNKGSFYYFFDSKPDLVHAAITAWWEPRRATLEEVLRPELPPLERIFKYADLVVEAQMRMYESDGYIHGTPVFRLGSEISMHHGPLRLLITQYINHHLRFFEEAIKDAQASGQLGPGDAALRARLLWGYNISMMTRAHIEQDPELMRNLGVDMRKLIDSELFRLDLDPSKKTGTDAKSPAPVDSEISSMGIEADGHKQEPLAELALMGEYANLMIVRANSRGRVEWANDSFVRTCGYGLEELRGKKPGALLQGPESDRRSIKMLHDSIRSAHP